jgi:hypothetical protein
VVTRAWQGLDQLERAIAERHDVRLAAFMRSAGTVQVRASRSTSGHRAPIASPVRAAVKIVSSSHRAATPAWLRSCVMNAGSSA